MDLRPFVCGSVTAQTRRLVPSETQEHRKRRLRNGARSARQEGKEGGQEMLGLLEVGDVPAVRYHYPGGPRYVVSGRRGELDEVAQPGRVLRRRVLTERHHVILLSDDQQRRGLDLLTDDS